MIQIQIKYVLSVTIANLLIANSSTVYSTYITAFPSQIVKKQTTYRMIAALAMSLVDVMLPRKEERKLSICILRDALVPQKKSYPESCTYQNNKGVQAMRGNSKCTVLFILCS